MENFDLLKELWMQPGQPLPDIAGLVKKAKVDRNKLMRTQLLGAVLLIVTGVLIAVMGLSRIFVFKSALTYWGMAVVALIPLLQGIVNLYVYKRLKALDITEAPASHLKKWEEYYVFRKWLIRLNGPAYFILLNLGFALYFIEIIGYMDFYSGVIALGIYMAWMLFAYFYLGKKAIAKEINRLNAIIQNLHEIERQLG